MTFLQSILSNVSPGTADILSYLMIVMVAIFILSGTAVTYFYYKKNRKERAAAGQAPA